MFKGSRRAITSIVTLIIMVSSMVMATGLITYGSDIFKTTQQSSISVQGEKIWVDATNPNYVSWAAVGIRNTGDKTIAVDKIVIRGSEVSFSNWYVDKNQTDVTLDNFLSQYESTSINVSGFLKNSSPNSQNCPTTIQTITIDFDGIGPKPTLCLMESSGPILLNPGERAILYFRVPNGKFSDSDVGSSSAINISAGTAISIFNTNVMYLDQLNSNTGKFVFIVRNNFSDLPSLVTLYQKHAGPADIIAQFYNKTLSNTVTSTITSQKSVTYSSIQDIQNNAQMLHSNGYSWIVYDLEPSLSPANEVADPVGSVQQAAQITHNNGMKLMITPAGMSQQYFQGMAINSDGFVLQAQDLINGDPAVFQNTIQITVNQIRSVNPSIMIILQGSTIKDTVDQINAAYDSTKSIVDGITIFYSGTNDLPSMAQIYTHIDGIS